MIHFKLRRIITICMLLSLAASFFLPSTVFADVPLEIEAQSNRRNGSITVSGLKISLLSVPHEGEALPTKAVVSSNEGISWEIPVLWMDVNGALASRVAGGLAYQPVLAFFLPDNLSTQSGPRVTIRLDDVLAALFGHEGAVSVYDASTGITYIMSPSIRWEYFASYADTENKRAETPIPGMPREYRTDWSAVIGSGYSQPTAPGQLTELEPPTGPRTPEGKPQTTLPISAGEDLAKLVPIHCSQTALDAMGADGLTEVVDLVVNKLEPQAVNLLINSFPAFQKAAKAGEISTQIGLYIYYEKGDRDGIGSHEDSDNDSLASVYCQAWQGEDKDTIYFGSLLKINLAAFVERNEKDQPILDENGHVKLSADPKVLAELENTIVHEMLHAFMYDYTRVGSTGAIYLKELLNEDMPYKKEIAFPLWFEEGFASAMENIYQYRSDTFQLLSYADGVIQPDYTSETLLTAYLKQVFNLNGEISIRSFNLEDALRSDVDSDAARYVSGYLAVLYLGNLAAKKQNLSDAVQHDSNHQITAISSETIRAGLNSILERLHAGETLDEVIRAISDGRYNSTEDFEKRFIKGTRDNEEAGYTGDMDSLRFCTDFLNYMRDLKNDTSRVYPAPNGSILFDFDRDFLSPLDRSKSSEAEFYQIVQQNIPVESTVPESTARATGGTSVRELAQELQKQQEAAAKSTDNACRDAGEQIAQKAKQAESEAIAGAEAAAQTFPGYEAFLSAINGNTAA